jgi:hypothetical protein
MFAPSLESDRELTSGVPSGRGVSEEDIVTEKTIGYAEREK